MLPELMLPGQREDIEKENDEGALEKKHSFELRPAPVASTRAQLCGNFNFENILVKTSTVTETNQFKVGSLPQLRGNVEKCKNGRYDRFYIIGCSAVNVSSSSSGVGFMQRL